MKAPAQTQTQVSFLLKILSKKTRKLLRTVSAKTKTENVFQYHHAVLFLNQI